MGDHIHSKNCGCDHFSADVDIHSLFQFINRDCIICLNESVPESGKRVFKPHDQRKSDLNFVESENDEELLFTIPFTANVKVTGLIISGTEESKHPKRISLYKDRPNINFDSVENPDQVIDLTPDFSGDLMYDLKPTKFSSLNHLSIYVSQNFGDELTKINYIGLKGKFMTQLRKESTVKTVYELRPTAAEAKIESLTSNRCVE